jgi:hypothetical protein
MRRRLTSTIGVFAVATMLVLPGSPASAAADDVQGVAPVQSETTSATEAAAAAAPRPFITDGDEVHISSTPPATASGHGWWISISHPRGTRGKVTIELQRQDYGGGAWKTVGTGSKTTYSGSGSANRAVARYTCRGIVGRANYRTVIDVDIIGHADTPEKAVTPVKTLWCW